MGNEPSVDVLLRNFHLNPIHSQGFRCAQNGCLQVIGGGKVVVIGLALALMAPWHSLRAEIDPCALVDEATLGPLGLTNRTTSKERKQEALPRPKTGSRTVDTCRSVAAGQELPTLVTVLGRPGKSGETKPLHCVTKSLFGLHTVSCALLRPEEDRAWVYVYRLAAMPDAEARFRQEVSRIVETNHPRSP